MTKNFIISTFLIFASCAPRCYNHFATVIDKSIDNKDTTLSVTARMWQGLYEYLALDIKIKRTDSLFVKNISVKPTLKDQPFFPWLDNYKMNSYYYIGKEGPYWQPYFSETFEKLPKENRKTNKDNLFVTYTINYNSEKEIDFEFFSATIVVVLVDNNGQDITYTKTFDFKGKHECHLSPH